MSARAAATPAAQHRGYLLDTSVLAALAPGRESHLPPGFAEWLLARSDRLFLPSIAIAELEQGICKLRRSGGAERAARLSEWLDGLLAAHGERVLPLDALTARAAGRMSEAATAQGKHPGFADVAIAAIASGSDLLLLTRNLKHFDPLGVACKNPIAGLPN